MRSSTSLPIGWSGIQEADVTSQCKKGISLMGCAYVFFNFKKLTSRSRGIPCAWAPLAPDISAAILSCTLPFVSCTKPSSSCYWQVKSSFYSLAAEATSSSPFRSSSSTTSRLESLWIDLQNNQPWLCDTQKMTTMWLFGTLNWSPLFSVKTSKIQFSPPVSS